MSDKTMANYLQMAVLMEKNGRDFYNQMADRFAGEEEICRIFARLAKDEQLHEQQFTEIAGKYSGEADEQAMNFLQAVSISRFFDEDYRKLVQEQVKGPGDALMLAFKFERATLLFYGALDEAQGGSEAMKQIMAAEKEHLFSLMKVILADARFRGLADQF